MPAARAAAFPLGTFDVVVVSSEQKYGGRWEGGQGVLVDAAGQQIKAVVANNGKEENPSNAYWPYVVSKLGRLKIDKAGKYHLQLKPEQMPAAQKFGITLVSVRLVPTK